MACIPTPPCPPNSTPNDDTTCTCTGTLVADASKTSCVPSTTFPTFGKGNGTNSCQSNQVYRGNPINIGTGLKSQTEIDYRASSGLEFNRVYNSQSSYGASWQQSLGQGWRTVWNRSIQGSPSAPPPYPPPIDYTVYRLGLGANWIADNTIITAYVSRGDGQTLTYRKSGGVWQSDADVNGQLTSQFDVTGKLTGWTYITQDQGTEQYNAAGQLVSITNRAGQTQTLTNSDGTAGSNGGYILNATGTATTAILPAGFLIRVTDAYARGIRFGYDAQYRIVKMTDPAGGVYHYAYDANDNLISVTYPDNKTKQYLYENTTFVHALTGIVDENGNRFATYTYDNSTGRAISTEHAGGVEKISLTYNSDGTTTETDALGTVRIQSFQNVLGLLRNGGVSQPGGSGCGASSSAQSYDANGNVASRVDFKGNSTCYAYDLTRNLETVRLEGVAPGTACPANLASYVPSTATGSVERKITTTWNDSYRSPTVVAEPLRITTYTYDTHGNLLTRTVQPTSDATGGAGLSATAAGTPRTTTYTYNNVGQVLTVDGARTDVTDVTSYTYDTQGNLTTVTNALNQVTTLGNYDANGRPGSLTDPNGLVTNLVYDARGRLTSRSAGGETTRYTYDGVGQLLTVTAPGGAVYTYTYDAAHRLTGIADNLGNRISYTLDAMGNRTKEQTFDSTGTLVQTHSRVFDALNRLYQDIGAVNQTTTYAYDANGNLTTITDPLNRQTINAYDALNRLSQTTDAASGITRYGYDGLDQLTQVTDPRNLSTQYQRDGLGNLNQQNSPDTGTTSNTYDAAGNILSRTDAKGQVATYTYDPLNRLIGISYTGGTANQTVSYQYDQGTNGIGHLTQIVDGTGTTNYSYDQHGRLTGEARQPAAAPGTSYTTGYSYDAQGRLSSITYPSGRVVSYTFDSMGRINQIATSYNNTSQIIGSNITYEPFGGVHSFTYGDGTATPVQTYVRQRDQDGRIASYTLNGHAMSVGYDAASQISFIADPQNLANTANYSYDALSRLTGYTQAAISQGYGYDADGNRVSQILGSTISSYGYAPDSNRLTSIQTGASTQSLTQDANGATTSDATRQYSYDLRGRLIQTTTAQGVINYEVNALGLRTRKQVPYANTDTMYFYDAQGHLIDESPTGSTQFTREYIYLGDQPVAVMQ